MLSGGPPGAIVRAIFPRPASAGMLLRVTDLAGRLMLEKSVEVGLMYLPIEIPGLSPGLYFLQVLVDGKVLAVERFVKE